MTKTKRLIKKAIKNHCNLKGYGFIRYQHGVKGHDFVLVDVWGIEVKVTVASTHRNGPDAAAKEAVSKLNKKVVRLIQNIIDGKQR